MQPPCGGPPGRTQTASPPPHPGGPYEEIQGAISELRDGPGESLLSVGPVWCGVVRCMVWCGLACGVVWYGMVWCGMVWYGMVWYGAVWYGMV